MGGKIVLGIVLVAIMLVVPMLNVGSGSSSNWGAWGKESKATPAPEESSGSAPLESIPEDAVEIIENPRELVKQNIATLVTNFNERYDYNLAPPSVEYTDSTHGEYFNDVVFLPKTILENTGRIEYVTAHETCHYFQDATGHFEAHGESFCEVFANANRTSDECEEKGWPYFYCSPFRLEEVNRQDFVDCIFGDGKSGEVSKTQLMSCYNSNKV